jgi:Mn2+/Fe2+ NRAMP family transporter
MLALADVDPIAMLFWSAVINGVVAVPIMLATMFVVTGRSAPFALPRWLIVLGWLGSLIMAASVLLLAWSAVRG